MTKPAYQPWTWALLAHAAVYVAATMAANYTAAWFIPLPLFGVVSVGTLFFGVTFTQRDRVHRYGRRAVYLMIAAAALLNTLESLFLGVPARIIIASMVAIVLAEAADTEVYQRLLQRSWLMRVAASNAVSIPLDTLLFSLIAFAGDPTAPTLSQIIVGDLVLKAVISMVAALVRTRRGRQQDAALQRGIPANTTVPNP